MKGHTEQHHGGSHFLSILTAAAVGALAAYLFVTERNQRIRMLMAENERAELDLIRKNKNLLSGVK